MFEYHDKKEQIWFLRTFNLTTEADREMMASIIHDLEHPLQSYCLTEAEYQMNEVTEGDDAPAMEDILHLAEELYDSESFVDAEFANLRAGELYENRKKRGGLMAKFAIDIKETHRKTVIIDGPDKLDDALDAASENYFEGKITVSPNDECVFWDVAPSPKFKGKPVPEGEDISNYGILEVNEG